MQQKEVEFMDGSFTPLQECGDLGMQSTSVKIAVILINMIYYLCCSTS